MPSGRLVVRVDRAIEILGTSERLVGWTSVEAWVEPDGTIGRDHDGRDCGEFSESSETVTDGQGRTVFVGSNGRDYTLDDLMVVDD